MKIQPEKADRLLETLATVLMAVATVATAWCAYQSTVFGSVQEFDLHEADVLNRQINSLRSSALQRSVMDVQIFTSWVDATVGHNQELADFYQQRFPPRLSVAFNEWIVGKPLTTPGAIPHPFMLPSYVLAENHSADSLHVIYEQKVMKAMDSNSHSEHYILLTVVFASVLFFGGITSNIKSIPTKTILVIGSTVLLACSLIWMLTFPMILR